MDAGTRGRRPHGDRGQDCGAASPSQGMLGPPGASEAGRASRRSKALAHRRTEIPQAARYEARKLIKLPLLGLPPAVQGLRLWAPNAAALGASPGWAPRAHKPHSGLKQKKEEAAPRAPDCRLWPPARETTCAGSVAPVLSNSATLQSGVPQTLLSMGFSSKNTRGGCRALLPVRGCTSAAVSPRCVGGSVSDPETWEANTLQQLQPASSPPLGPVGRVPGSPFRLCSPNVSGVPKETCAIS